MGCSEAEISQITVIKNPVGVEAAGLEFTCASERYEYY